MHSLSRVISASAVLGSLWAPIGAQALTLPDPIIRQVINIESQLYSDQVGTISKSTAFTSGNTSVYLGSFPTITAQMSESSGGRGGSVYSRLLYNVEYINPGVYSNINVSVNAFDQLTASGSGYSFSAFTNSFLSISGNGQSISFDHCSSASSTGDICGNHGRDPIGPFTFSMLQNTVYTVDMSVNVQAIANIDSRGLSTATAYALLDPTFKVLGEAPQGGYFIFSPGITAQLPVPEPDASALIFAGLVLLGFVVRRKSV